MSNRTSSADASSGPRDDLMLSLAALLIPLFKASATDAALAHRAAVSAIEAYHPRSRADLVNIARTIAFSMTALAVLAATASQDMTLAEQMRAFGRANALNRSADQSERTMMRRWRDQQAEPPAPAAEPAALDITVDDSEIRAEIAKIMQQYAAIQPIGPEAPLPEPAPPPAEIPLMPRAAAPATAIHAAVPRSLAGKPPAAPYREALLRQTAMPPVIAQNRTHAPS